MPDFAVQVGGKLIWIAGGHLMGGSTVGPAGRCEYRISPYLPSFLSSRHFAYIYSLHGRQVTNESTPPANCIPVILGRDASSSNFILGKSFLWHSYVVFDRGNSRIGFAQR